MLLEGRRNNRTPVSLPPLIQPYTFSDLSVEASKRHKEKGRVGGTRPVGLHSRNSVIPNPTATGVEWIVLRASRE